MDNDPRTQHQIDAKLNEFVFHFITAKTVIDIHRDDILIYKPNKFTRLELEFGNNSRLLWANILAELNDFTFEKNRLNFFGIKKELHFLRYDFDSIEQVTKKKHQKDLIFKCFIDLSQQTIQHEYS